MSKKYFFTDINGALYPEWEQKGFTEVLEPVPTKKYQIFTTDIKLMGKFEVVDQGKSQIAGYSDEQDKVFYNVPAIVYGDHTTIVKFRRNEFIIGADGTKVLVVKDSSNSPEFLFHALCYYNVEPEGYKRHYSIVKSISLPLPSLPEQQKIAEFFGALDERIALTADRVRLLKDQKKGYLQQVFNRELVFTDDNGDPYPEWEQKKLGEVVEYNQNRGTLPDQFYYVDLESVNSGVISGKKLVTKEEAPSRAQRKLRDGDILFQNVRPYQNNHFVFHNDGWDKQVVASTGFTQMEPRQDVCSSFIYHAVMTPKFSEKVMVRCTGTSYPAINSSELMKIDLSLPSLSEQEKIAGFFSALDERVELTENKLALLKEQKKGYLQGIFG